MILWGRIFLGMTALFFIIVGIMASFTGNFANGSFMVLIGIIIFFIAKRRVKPKQ